MAGRISQTLPQRYIDRADLKDLLQRLFGQDFETEVSALIPRLQVKSRLYRSLANSNIVPGL